MNRCDCPTEIDEARVRTHLQTCSPRDALLVDLGQETGLRVSELVALRVENVWRNGAPVSVLRVPRRLLKGGKPGSRVAKSVPGRSIPVNATLQSAIVRAMAARPGAAPDEPLFVSRKFGQSLTRRQATRIVRDLFRAAGLDPCRVWAAASLRRRFARRIFDQTGSIELVRVAISHRWVTTTQCYVGLHERDATSAILALGRGQEVLQHHPALASSAAG
jgi:site-specific recombinase XerD